MSEGAANHRMKANPFIVRTCPGKPGHASHAKLDRKIELYSPSIKFNQQITRYKMNLPLPEADSAIAAEVREWLDRFAICVREVDYAAARSFWHPDIVIFGTYQELVKSLSAWTERQWDNVWPRTAEFRFDLANTMVMAAPDGAIAIAIAPWTSTGFHEDGMAFDRPGRATIVLARQPDGRWLGVHSHMSLARGVPQDSHGKRAVKAR